MQTKYLKQNVQIGNSRRASQLDRVKEGGRGEVSLYFP